MKVSLRCHNSPRRYWVTRCGWRHAPEARGSLCENLKKIRVGFLDAEREGSILELAGARRTCARWGPLELGAKWIRQHRRLCLSSLRRNLLLKVDKKVSYLNKKSLRVFEIPVLYMFCSIEHYMSISHMAIFVYMATQHRHIWYQNLGISFMIWFSIGLPWFHEDDQRSG